MHYMCFLLGIDLFSFLLQVTFAYMKHLWQAGQRKMAFSTLSRFVQTQAQLMPTPYMDVEEGVAEEDSESDKLLARLVGGRVVGECYVYPLSVFCM